MVWGSLRLGGSSCMGALLLSWLCTTACRMPLCVRGRVGIPPGRDDADPDIVGFRIP